VENTFQVLLIVGDFSQRTLKYGTTRLA